MAKRLPVDATKPYWNRVQVNLEDLLPQLVFNPSPKLLLIIRLQFRNAETTVEIANNNLVAARITLYKRLVFPWLETSLYEYLKLWVWCALLDILLHLQWASRRIRLQTLASDYPRCDVLTNLHLILSSKRSKSSHMVELVLVLVGEYLWYSQTSLRLLVKVSFPSGGVRKFLNRGQFFY